MQILLLVALGIALLAVVFALQNIVPVNVSFFGWTFEGSLALVLFVSLIAGVVVSLAASAPSMVRDRRALRRLRRQVTDLDRELADVRGQLTEARRQLDAPSGPEPVPDEPGRTGFD